MKKQCPLDKSIQCWPTATCEGTRLLLSPGRDRTVCFFLVFFPANLEVSKRRPSFSVSSCRRKKPNVCLLSPVLTSSLPPLSLSAPPVLVAQFARTALRAAVQRQPQHPQPDQLPWLLPWGVLPAADRADQRDSEPGGQWPLTVCCQGPGVLHSGPKGKGLISFQHYDSHWKDISRKTSPHAMWHESFSTNTRKPVAQLGLHFIRSKPSRWRAGTVHTSMCFTPFYHIHLFRFYFPKQTSGPRAP